MLSPAQGLPLTYRCKVCLLTSYGLFFSLLATNVFSLRNSCDQCRFHILPVNANDSNKYTHLHYAFEEGHAEVPMTLLDKGVHSDPVKNLGSTSLQFSANNGHDNLVGLPWRTGLMPHFSS